MLKIAPPWTRQPQYAARLKRSHWLYDDLIFVHSGTHGYVYGEPVAPTLDAPRVPKSGIYGSHLNNSLCFSGDGTNYATYALPKNNALPLTLSGWAFGINANSTDNLVRITETGAVAGVELNRTTLELFEARARTSANSSNAASSTGTWVSGAWHHGVAVHVSSVSRIAYFDGGNSGSTTTGRDPGTALNTVEILRLGSPTISATALQGVQLPMVIGRALSAVEVAQLYEEQRQDPWALFERRRIWVPASTGATVPTLSASTYVTGSLTSTGWRPQITAS